MTIKKIIFSDIDGTLCFHSEAHHVKEIRKNDDGTVLVEDTKNKTQNIAYDVSASSFKIYLDRKTRELGKELQKHYTFIFVSGARQRSTEARKKYFDFADGYILESGGLILDTNFKRDEEWHQLLEPERKKLQKVKAELLAKNWVVDDEGRTSALRIRLKDNPHKSAEELQILTESLVVPDELQKTSNLGHLDIILKSAGKANAVKYWMQKKGYSLSVATGIGDDINDLEFLRICGQQYVLASAFGEAIELAKKEGWRISSQPNFAGINEILEELLKPYR